MKLLFDLQALQPDSYGSTFHGGGEYARYYFNESIKMEIHSKHELSCIYNGSKNLDEKIIDLCNKKNIKLFDTTKIDSLQDFIDNHNFDVFYTALPFDDYFNLKLKKCKYIYTLFDLRTLEMPYDIYEYKFQKTLKKRITIIFKILLKNLYLKIKKNKFKQLMDIQNKTLITGSFHSKYSIMNFFPQIDYDQIKVIYCPIKNSAIKFTQKEENDILSKYGLITKEFFLIISANRWIKNPYRAVKAFDTLFSNKQINKKVLILGTKNKKTFNIKNIDNFIFGDYVEEEELQILYKNAFALFYPSLHEGFGYPPIETMKYGTPVIASAISSITEICEDSVLYFNPYSIDEMKMRILRLYNDSEIYKELSVKGKKRYGKLVSDQEKTISNDINTILGIGS